MLSKNTCICKIYHMHYRDVFPIYIMKHSNTVVTLRDNLKDLPNYPLTFTNLSVLIKEPTFQNFIISRYYSSKLYWFSLKTIYHYYFYCFLNIQ